MDFTTCNHQILSNDYYDYIIEYNGYKDYLSSLFPEQCINFVNNRLAVLYKPTESGSFQEILQYGYAYLPKCYGLMDSSNMDASGIRRIQQQPVLNLKGQGILIGIVDSGIDYENMLFRNADSSTRIVSIWDQTIESTKEKSIYNYGTEYTASEINSALNSTFPRKVVPTTDDIGHGTFIAGIAAGGYDEKNDFTGAAPLSDLCIVKLKQAKKYLRNFYAISDNATVYQENDIMLGIQYIAEKAVQLLRPVVICIGCGTSTSGHDGYGNLDQYLSNLSTISGFAVTIPAGNEGTSNHHYSGNVPANMPYDTVEINVGENTTGFTLEFWGNAPNTYAIGFITPNGNIIEKIPPRFELNLNIDFILEESKIYIDYQLIEQRSGDQLIFIRFENPTRGIWKLLIYADTYTDSQYNIWLPISDFLSSDTFFIKPNPDVTITSPSASQAPMAVTAYDHISNNIYVNSSRGYTRINVIKPDFAAPGVNIMGPGLNNTFVIRSGTSIACAHAAGASALMLEWGINRGNKSTLTGVEIKRFLIRGAKRSSNLKYPNNIWGVWNLGYI